MVEDLPLSSFGIHAAKLFNAHPRKEALILECLLWRAHHRHHRGCQRVRVSPSLGPAFSQHNHVHGVSATRHALSASALTYRSPADTERCEHEGDVHLILALPETEVERWQRIASGSPVLANTAL
jgi:hypothetical protein